MANIKGDFENIQTHQLFWVRKDLCLVHAAYQFFWNKYHKRYDKYIPGPDKFPNVDIWSKTKKKMSSAKGFK